MNPPQASRLLAKNGKILRPPLAASEKPLACAPSGSAQLDDGLLDCVEHLNDRLARHRGPGLVAVAVAAQADAVQPVGRELTVGELVVGHRARVRIAAAHVVVVEAV